LPPRSHEAPASPRPAVSTAHAQPSSGLGYVIPSQPPAAAHCPVSIHTSIAATANTNAYGQSYVSGSVIIRNEDQHAAPITSVAVALYNTVAVVAIYITADCPVDSVQAGGQIFCQFTATLPVSGPASSPSVWTQAQETVTYNGAACPSVTTQVQGPPLVGGSQGGT